MKVIEIPISKLCEAPWNPNQMDEGVKHLLKNSLSRYGLVEPLVVRPSGEDGFEVLSGNQRLKVLSEMNKESALCVIVELGDMEAMLLTQAINGIKGQDDLALKGILLKELLSAMPESEILSLLPETSNSLQTLAAINKESLADHLKAWEQAQTAKLSHLQLQFTRPQLETVQEAVSLIMPVAKNSPKDNPNTRSTAIFLLCKFYIERRQPE
ncbi:ParB/RepB/Spo0J family partition protein [Dehalococcoides mccartyi]|uniref:ParB/RepB/Spo0J family partition protein n=1 Tax=Dehalococcoides mccartyi TaxID=61435 RepID=UPI000805A27B|nr:ParB N-terminal domain-containing protein [Dehalococcoides mccartyi]OBW61024.1 MAG: chromosome partitioning protein ParB [Dehalococcoides mccartyi]